MKADSKKALLELANGSKWSFFIFVAIVFFVIYSAERTKFNDVKDVVSTLQSLSAAIFTIVGLWVGFLYPNAIQSIVTDNVDYIKNNNDAPRIEKLIYVIITSALVMLGTLIFYLFKSISTSLPLYVDHKLLFKIASLSLIYFMCWMQVKCVISVIISNLRFANNLHSRISSSRIQNDNK